MLTTTMPTGLPESAISMSVMLRWASGCNVFSTDCCDITCFNCLTSFPIDTSCGLSFLLRTSPGCRSANYLPSSPSIWMQTAVTRITVVCKQSCRNHDAPVQKASLEPPGSRSVPLPALFSFPSSPTSGYPRFLCMTPVSALQFCRSEYGWAA